MENRDGSDEKHRATEEDVFAIALSLPQAELRKVTAGRRACSVSGQDFLVERGPRKDALDENGKSFTDIVMMRTADLEEKAALLADPGMPLFTTPHFDRYPAVLFRMSRVGEFTLSDLTECITGAWAALAPDAVAQLDPPETDDPVWGALSATLVRLGATVTTSRFADKPAVALGSREIAHREEDGHYDLRITGPGWTAVKTQYADSPLVQRDPKRRDWLTLALASSDDVTAVSGLLAETVRRNG